MRDRSVILISILSVGGLLIATPCFPYGPPDPLRDRDDDGLCDYFEYQLFSTDPYNTDTDEDGIPDGDEDHDGDGLTNIQEQEHIVAPSEELRNAIRRGDIERVKKLLDFIPYIPAIDRYRKTALETAIESGHTEIVQLLLQAGADVNAPGHSSSALILATKRGRTEIVSLLIEAGASLNVQDYTGRRALWYAKREGHNDIVDLLIKAGALE